MSTSETSVSTSAPQRTGALVGVLAGIVILVSLNLRPAITGVGPISDLIQASTGLSTSAMGMLASIPVFCMGIGALLTPALIKRIGMDTTVTCALVGLGVTIVVRSFIPGVGLWVGTVGVGLMIGLLNAVLPPIIKRDFPQRATGLTGLYSAALTLSSAVSAGVSVPIAGASSWRIATGIWVLLVVIGVVAWAWSMRVRSSLVWQGAYGTSGRQENRIIHDEATLTRPVWKVGLAWAMTSFMGLQSFLFYTMVQWLPDLEKSTGVLAEVAGVHMMFFQMAGLAATLIITAVQGERADQRVVTVGTALAWGVGLAGMLLAPGAVLMWVILMGGGSGASFYTALSFISTRTSTTAEASAVSGMSQSVGYFIAAVGPTLAGMLAESVSWNAVLAMALVVNAVLLGLGLIAGRPVKM